MTPKLSDVQKEVLSLKEKVEIQRRDLISLVAVFTQTLTEIDIRLTQLEEKPHGNIIRGTEGGSSGIEIIKDSTGRRGSRGQ